MIRRVFERNMFYGANKQTFLKAVALRNDMTKAEELLWEVLKDRKLFKARWRRQHPIDIFIADFYCHEYKLVVEVDGDIHLLEEKMEYDDCRNYVLEKYGIRIIRFTNCKIFYNIEDVKSRIQLVISSLSPL
jgi:very-short-patch-repair endonuclease